jgi:glutamate-ammonia-ligase adenylyltransferase
LPDQKQQLERLARDSTWPSLARANLTRLIESGGTGSLKKLPASYLQALVRLLGGSAHLSDILIREGKDWPDLFVRQINRPKRTAEAHLAEIRTMLGKAASPDRLATVLRRHKQHEVLRIGARDLALSQSVEETTEELTALAEASLEAAYRFCRSEVEKDFGPLLLPGQKKKNRFVILGMGKLGGGELNFSSDIDIVYLYEDQSGESRGGTKGKATPNRFFTRLAEMITRVMGEVTEDGFVFRTDLRLRPLGRNGPLVQSCSSALLYYESWGQCWERAALIKARPVGGNKELGVEFLRDLEPFVYRRYLDFTTVEELRHMKMRIERELLGLEERERNVKLGRGGIREIEFFTQALQLVNGGYEPGIRKKNTLSALSLLARFGFIPSREKESLTSAYRFLRNVEHKIQMVHEAQTHTIPAGDEEEACLARRLGFAKKEGHSERDLFWRAYRKHTARVRRAFDRLFYGAQKEITQEKRSGFAEIWNDLDQEELILEDLKRLGFPDPERGYRNFLAVRDGEPYSPPSPRRLKVMRALGPALMAEIVQSVSPDRALFNLAEFSHRVGARTGFLSLLAENPKTMHLLITLFANSQFLSDLFLGRPELLDSLIRVDLARLQRNREEMLRELAATMAQAGDLEGRLNSMRRYRAEEFLRIGLHDLGGRLGLEEVICQLSDLAEACLEGALMLSIQGMEKSYGKVRRGKFAVLGMGKLGGREIDYSSDLDLIFIYDAPEDAQSQGGTADSLGVHEYYVRLGQKLITFITAPTEEGFVYRVDMRLRPSGRFGPLVTSLGAYCNYHQTSSELWERQALIKMRFVAGDRNLGTQVEALAEQVAYGRGLTQDEVAKIHHLRMRMERELAGESLSQFNLKKGKGGMVDVEFITQMLQLSYGYRYPGLRLRAILKALRALHLHKIIKKGEYRLLSEGYLFLRQLDHQLRLERAQSIDILEREGEKVQGIAQMLGYTGSRKSDKNGKKTGGYLLLRDYEHKRDQIRSCYKRLFSITA